MAEKGIRVQIYGDYNDKDIRKAMRDLQSLQGAGMSVGGKMQAFGGQMQAMGRQVGAVGRGLTLGVTMPIIGIGVAALTAGATFEKSMNKVRAVSGVTGDEFEQLKTAAKEMGRTTQFSASQAADGMTFLAMAGFKTNEIVTALPATLNLAAVGEMELAAAADIASNVLGGFNMTAEKTNQVVDVMAEVSANANTNVAQMGEAMSYAAPIANTAGISIEAAAAFIGRLGDAGIQSSRAGTTLVGVIGALENATPKAAKRLKELGIQTHTASGELLPLDNIVAQLGKSSITAGDFLSIFGKRAGPGLAAVVGMGVDGLTALEQKAIDSGGAAERMANVQLEGLAGQMVKLKSAFEGLLIGIADSGLLDIVTDFFVQLTEKVSGLVQTIEKMSPETKKLILMFVGVAAAVGPVLMVVGKLMVVIGGLIKVFGAITIAGTLIAIKVVAIVAVLALLVGAFVLAWRSSEPLRNAVRELFGVLQTLGRVIVDTVLGAFRTLTGEGNTVGGILQTVGRIAGQILTPIIRTLTTIVKGVGAAFQVAGKIFEVQVTVFRMIAGVIRAVVIAAIDILMNKLGPLSRSFRSMATGLRSAFNVVAGAVVSLFNNAGKILEGFVNRAIRVVNTIIDAYNVLARALGGMQQVSRITEFRLNSMAAAQDGAVVSLNNAATATFNAASATGANIREMERAEAPTKKLGKGFEDLIPVVEGAGGATKAAGDEADKAATKLKRFQDVFTAGLNHLKAATADVQKAYDDMATSVSQAIFGAFDFSNIDPNRIGENGEKVGGSWLDGLQSQADKAIAFSKKVAEVIKLGLEPGSPAFEAVMQVTKQQGDGLLNELIAGGVEAVDKSIAIVNSVKDAADQVGIDAADQFHGTGLTLAKQAEEGFAKRFGKDGPGYNKINRLMTALSKSLTRTAFIDVVTRYRNEGSAGTGTLAVGATGGIVNRPTFALIGEAGPEAVVPLSRTPGNEPLTLTRNAGGRKDVSTTINVTVNAGIGTDGAEVGRQIVDTIKQYERRNGPVYVAA
jgi:TP901 family phage tail tape measure protein